MNISGIPTDKKLSIHIIKGVTYLATGWWEYPSDRPGAVLWKAVALEVKGDGTLVPNTKVTIKPKDPGVDTIYVDAEPMRALVAKPYMQGMVEAALLQADVEKPKTKKPRALNPKRFVKYWEVIHKKTGTKLSGNNMSELVKQNAQLFEPEDLIWKNSSCNAASRLYQMFAKKWRLESWKGWFAVKKLDEPPSLESI